MREVLIGQRNPLFEDRMRESPDAWQCRPLHLRNLTFPVNAHQGFSAPEVQVAMAELYRRERILRNHIEQFHLDLSTAFPDAPPVVTCSSTDVSAIRVSLVCA